MWKEQFDEKFNWASFTWNGDYATGVRFAKNKKMQVKRFISSEIIEKLIEEALPDNLPHNTNLIRERKQQLRDKWL